jgi:uracil-DNA glycosylase family 4
MEKYIKAKCDICPLKDSIFVPSELHKSNIVALAEAPGYYEALQGRPLISDQPSSAGRVLSEIWEELKVSRDDFYLVNAVSCRPTDGRSNRTPTDEEINCCNDRLIAELKLYNPTVIVAMGRVPYVALHGKVDSQFRMSSVAGTEFIWNNIKVLVTNHPAAVGHSGGKNSEKGSEYYREVKSAFEKALTKITYDVQIPMFELAKKYNDTEIVNSMCIMRDRCHGWLGERPVQYCKICRLRFFCGS